MRLSRVSAAESEAFSDHARLNRLENEMLALTEALTTLMVAHRDLVQMLVLASVPPKTGEMVN